MTAGSPLSFPGSQVLSGWWRQLTPWQPHSLWVAHLLLHRVEALVRLSRPAAVDSFTALLLDLLARQPGQTLDRLDARLHLGRQILWQTLRHLEAEGLTSQDAASGWSATPLGRSAATRVEYPRAVFERRVFHFRVPGDPTLTPHFLAVDSSATRPAHAELNRPRNCLFDVQHLEACLRQSAEWKRRHAFPHDIEALVTLAEPRGDARVPDWRKVIVARLERLPAALILSADHRLLGFTSHGDDWTLDVAQPAFELEDREDFPELADDIDWRSPLQAWGAAHGLDAELAACDVRRHGHHLEVSTASPLLHQALASETWLLAGEADIRAAIQLVAASGA